MGRLSHFPKTAMVAVKRDTIEDRHIGPVDLAILMWFLAANDGLQYHPTLLVERFGISPEQVDESIGRLSRWGYLVASSDEILLTGLAD